MGGEPATSRRVDDDDVRIAFEVLRTLRSEGAADVHALSDAIAAETGVLFQVLRRLYRGGLLERSTGREYHLSRTGELIADRLLQLPLADTSREGFRWAAAGPRASSLSSTQREFAAMLR